jgi:hypothetical protein
VSASGAEVPAAAEPVAAEPVAAEPVAAEPVAAEPTASSDSSASAAQSASTASHAQPPATPPAKPRRTGRLARLRSQFYLRGRQPRMPRSRRGLFALLLVLSGFGAVVAFSSISLVSWTETADFCGRCHSMEPELMAYEMSAHETVSCAECHVEPGPVGWVKAKLNGTRQLIETVLGTYPTPIPPPSHAELPDPKHSCAHCHDPSRRALAGLKSRTTFTEDEANTPQYVGLMLRPGGGDTFDVDRSVHWHILRDVEYVTPDEDAASIDYVAATMPDGTVNEYIAGDKITYAEDVQPDIDEIKAEHETQTMNCYSCHNRAGHPIPNPRSGIDQLLVTGALDRTLPYIKREAMRLLFAGYPDEETADAEIDKLRGFYELNYPDVAVDKADDIDAAIKEIKALYRLTATPEMRVTAQTYPDHMGHLDFPGCFRCHDGGHFLVEDGVATTKTIPSTCDACHTFPQIGPAVASLPLGEPPADHDDNLWVFNHKNVATDLDPGGQSCGDCHARDYCVNCHSTGAVTVEHDAMATNHAAVIRESGNQSCAYCHQPVYCARCHQEPVLPVTTPFSHGPDVEGIVPTRLGVTWPLDVAARSPGSSAGAAGAAVVGGSQGSVGSQGLPGG